MASKIKILNAHHYYDIFTGEGWYNHTRVRRIRSETGFVFKYISGNKIHPEIINNIMKGIK